jgi:hypothetical protein
MPGYARRADEFRFTRSGSDSIRYYTQPGTVYPGGFLRTGGRDHNSLGLACRFWLGSTR